MPTTETRQRLYDELDYQRAVQAAIWAEPAINNALFRQAMEVVGTPNLGATLHDKRQQPRHETLTPNQSVIYLYDIINLKDTGPVVYTAPAGPIDAGFFDMWMRPFYDFGIVGPNKYNGDRILLVPPGYKGRIPTGYQVASPKTCQVFTIARVSVKEGMTEKQGSELLQKMPAKVPAKDFWALTVYDIQTRALIEAPQHVAEINPNVQKLQTNAEDRLTSSSVRKLPRAWSRTGFRPFPVVPGSRTSAGMARPRPTTTSRGGCRTSSR